MPTITVLCNNIFDEGSAKRLRGETFEASQGFIDMVLDGDEAAERHPRIAVISKKRGRPAKVKADEAE